MSKTTSLDAKCVFKFETIFDSVEFLKFNPSNQFIKTEFGTGILRGCVEDNIFLIHYIEIKKELRNTGILKNFLQQIDRYKFSKIVFLGVQSQILDDFLSRYEHPKNDATFFCQGADWILEL